MKFVKLFHAHKVSYWFGDISDSLRNDYFVKYLPFVLFCQNGHQSLLSQVTLCRHEIQCLSLMKVCLMSARVVFWRLTFALLFRQQVCISRFLKLRNGRHIVVWSLYACRGPNSLGNLDTNIGVGHMIMKRVITPLCSLTIVYTLFAFNLINSSVQVVLGSTVAYQCRIRTAATTVVSAKAA
jgi:hypothetical protein